MEVKGVILGDARQTQLFAVRFIEDCHSLIDNREEAT